MIDNCEWVTETDANGKPYCRSVCCGHVIDQVDPTKCFARCKVKTGPLPFPVEHRVGLGDRVARWIALVYKKPPCNPCLRRKEKLNRFGNWIRSFFPGKNF